MARQGGRRYGARMWMAPELADIEPSCAHTVCLAGLSGQVQKRRLDAPAEALGLAEAELREDRIDVTFDSAFGDHDALRDRRVAPAFRDEREDLLLARSERVEARVLVP